MCSQRRNFHLVISGFLGLMLIFLSGCNSELSEVCSGKYDHAITDAMAQIEPYRNVDAHSRSLASLKVNAQTAQRVSMGEGSLNLPSGMPTGMNEDERDHWQSWAEKEIKRVEVYIDWANLHREESPQGEVVRRRLTDVANRLVAFHGYSQAGRVERMLDVLKAIDADQKEVQGAVCGRH